MNSHKFVTCIKMLLYGFYIAINFMRCHRITFLYNAKLPIQAGLTPLEYATNYGHEAVVKVIRDFRKSANLKVARPIRICTIDY